MLNNKNVGEIYENNIILNIDYDIVFEVFIFLTHSFYFIQRKKQRKHNSRSDL